MSITSANSILMIGVTGLFPVPQQLQGFGADDAYDIDPVETAEVMLGVDGILSAGYVPQIKTMHVTLQADSPSAGFFEAWYAAQEATMQNYKAFGVIHQDAIGRIYTLTNGVLSNYSPIAGAKKVLQPRKFEIKWQMALGAPI